MNCFVLISLPAAPFLQAFGTDAFDASMPENPKLLLSKKFS